MRTDKKGVELGVGDSVLYISTTPKPFTFRGEVVGFTPVGTSRVGEMLYLVDVGIKFVNKEPAKSSVVRVWSGDLEKYDPERINFV